MPERRYDQNELATILRVAAEAQAEQSIEGSEPSGLTLGEIERVASEVGIDPKFVATAADRLEKTPAKGKRFLLGGTPNQEIVERTFDGTLSDVGWEEIVADLRATFGSEGTVSQVGSSREWTGTTDTRTTHFSATSRNGKTRYRLTLRQTGGVILAWTGLSIGSLLGSILVGVATDKMSSSALAVVLAVLTVIATVALLVHTFLARWHSGNRRSVNALMARVGDMTSASDQQALGATAQQTEELAARLTERA